MWTHRRRHDHESRTHQRDETEPAAVRVVWPAEPLHVVIDPPPPPPRAVATRAVLHVTGATTMPAALTVDSTGKKLSLAFEDDKGNVTDTPAGATVTFASDNSAAATVAADPANPLAADITVVAEGAGNFTATLAGALEADGVTPIPDPAALPFTVGPGPAAQAVLTTG